MSTPFCFVIRQFLGFFPGQVHLSEVSFDDIYPVLPWSSWSLVTSQLPVCCLTSCFRVVHSQDVSQPPEPSFFNYISSFLEPVFFLMSSFLTLSLRVILHLFPSFPFLNHLPPFPFPPSHPLRSRPLSARVSGRAL